MRMAKATPSFSNSARMTLVRLVSKEAVHASKPSLRSTRRCDAPTRRLATSCKRDPAVPCAGASMMRRWSAVTSKMVLRVRSVTTSKSLSGMTSTRLTTATSPSIPRRRSPARSSSAPRNPQGPPALQNRVRGRKHCEDTLWPGAVCADMVLRGREVAPPRKVRYRRTSGCGSDRFSGMACRASRSAPLGKFEGPAWGSNP